MEHRISHVLVPTDLSEGGVTALRYARFLSDHLASRLTVMHAAPVIYPVDVMGELPSLYATVMPEHLNRLEAEVRSYAAPAMEGREFEVYVCTGQPVSMIVQAAEARNADLLVMGTHALRGWRRAILGSVTEGVLHSTRWPVLTVSSLHRMPVMHGEVGITKIVCPVNFSEVAHEALTHAAWLAELLSAEVVVVHVIEPGQESDIAADEARVREWVAPELRNLFTFRELVLRGGAAERVLDCVDDIGADLLVIGAQHRLFRDSTVIGATTERLVRFASCPVLTVVRATAQSLTRTTDTNH